MKTALPPTHISHLRCSGCGMTYDLREAHSFSFCCGKPLVVEYGYYEPFLKADLEGRPASMWRYFEMLPVLEKENIISLGEGMTALYPLRNLARKYGLPNLLLKDEGLNPTGSFKARGMSVAVSKAREAGIETCIVPTAGNAGGALSAYCARAGMNAIIVMPRHTPRAFRQECELLGARVVLVDGLISDCAEKVAEIKSRQTCFDVSTLKEPYRLEGKKTMGYEIAEQLNWELPDVIIYPTGGGTGLIGIWKAFREMMEMEWLNGPLPRMIAVQALNCQPIVQIWNGRQPDSRHYRAKPSLANGLVVPHPFGEDLILDVLEESGGMPVAVSDDAMLAGLREIAREEGLLVSPEGAATWAGLLLLIREGKINPEERILLLNTGSGYKYLENIV